MVKKLSVLVYTLVCFLVAVLVPWDLAYAAKAHQQARENLAGRTAQAAAAAAASVRTPERPAAAIEAALRRVERLLDRLETATGAGPALAMAPSDRQAVLDAAATVEREAAKLLAQLARTADKLSQTNGPPKYGQRNRERMDRLESDLTPLTEALGRLADADLADRPAAIAAVRAAIAETVGAERHNPVDPDNLPHRPIRATPDEPRTETAAFRASLSTVKLVAEATAPGPDDLAESPDVRFTPALAALADSLDDDPLAIYNWVRQNVLFVPTWGSIQGSEGCLLSLECNAHDTASLLVALLREAGVPARYAMGTVEVTPELFRSAMGDFADLQAAGTLSASGGIPTVSLGDGQGNTVAMRIEHVWVEAFVDYVPSRTSGATGETWVPLDAALKPTRFQVPTDFEALTGTDYEEITDALDAAPAADGSFTNVPTAAAADSLEDMVAALEPALDDQLPDATLGELFGGLVVEAPELPLLPASLPARVITVGGRMAELPASSRHRLEIAAFGSFGSSAGLQLTVPTIDLADRRLTLNYVPATQADRDLAESFGGIYTTPPHLLDVRPQLLLEGVPVTAGNPVRMGTMQTLRITFREPGRSDSVEHQIAAGTYAAIGVDLQLVSREQTERRRAMLDAAEAELLDFDVDTRVDDVLGESLHVHGQSYFQQVEAANRMAAHHLGVRAIKRPAEGLVTGGPGFGYLFGTAVETGNISFNIDVRRYLVSVASLDGDPDDELQYMLSSGSAGSAAEHQIFEMLQGTESVSAVKLLGVANEQGIPIYQIDSANLAQVLPLLDLPSAVRSDVVNSVNAGKIVTVPQHAFQYLDWSGLGYLVIDPVTGAAGYLISGGLAGGGTAEDDGEGSDVWSLIVMFFSWAANQGGDDVILKALAKLGAGFQAVKLIADWLGRIAIGVSAIFTFFSTWKSTGSFWKGLGAGLVDLLFSLLVGMIIASAFIAGLTLGWTIFAILVISLIATILVNLINGWLFSWVPLLNRLRDRYAQSSGPPGPWWSSGGFGPLFGGLAAVGV
ncbi:MAG TPA: transglutaminase domain-containing protein [Thermoanaerobaculia bacterium]|nr:transglutaminase domain-containing protein [Thermoanaerobaculia bacterium]